MTTRSARSQTRSPARTVSTATRRRDRHQSGRRPCLAPQGAPVPTPGARMPRRPTGTLRARGRPGARTGRSLARRAQPGATAARRHLLRHCVARVRMSCSYRARSLRKEDREDHHVQVRFVPMDGVAVKRRDSLWIVLKRPATKGAEHHDALLVRDECCKLRIDALTHLTFEVGATVRTNVDRGRAHLVEGEHLVVCKWGVSQIVARKILTSFDAHQRRDGDSAVLPCNGPCHVAR
eukprot:2021724-Prymnesium_polylepis.2